MIRVNENYGKLVSSYLFSDIAKRVTAFQEANPDKAIIKLGIGDVTEPLPPVCIEAMRQAAGEMGQRETFRGYGPEQGYDFLREAIAENDYRARGCGITAGEVFVSDGAKCDVGNFQELFAADTRVAVMDPVYPVYVDTNVMAGRTGISENNRYTGLTYLECTEANGYVPALPEGDVDLIYLCFPNNPTGGVATRKQLEGWIDYAREHRALILFDAAYETFIRDDSLPHSIYEIDRADEVAVEFRSFSKAAGFTGARCAFTVVPNACQVYTTDGTPQALHALWNRRHTTKFNGVSYPIQRAAEAIYTAEGKCQTRELVDYYLRNARVIREKMSSLGYAFVGGENSPYIWVKTEGDSWEFFDRLLDEAAVVTTPGSGFGRCGQGYIRISAFNQYEKVQEAMDRIAKVLG